MASNAYVSTWVGVQPSNVVGSLRSVPKSLLTAMDDSTRLDMVGRSEMSNWEDIAWDKDVGSGFVK